MKKIFSHKVIRKIKIFAASHKIISAIAVLAILVSSYWGYKKINSTDGETRYVTAEARKGTIIVSVTGSGQVSASNQIDLKPKVSGDVVYVGVVNGQEVRAGTLIAQLDARDAQKSVRDAEVGLESANLSLEKLQKPADTLSLIQGENALVSAEQAKEKAGNDLKKSYDDAFTSISNAFLDLPAVVTGIQDVLYKTTYSSNQDNISYYADAVKNYDDSTLMYKKSAADAYQEVRAAYDKNFLDYKTASRYSDNATIENLLDETYATAKSAAESAKNADNFLSFVKDQLSEHAVSIPSQLSAHQTSIATCIDKINSNLVGLLNSRTAIKNAKDNLESSSRGIREKTELLNKLKAGSDPLDLESSRLSVRQRENALLDAREKLADYFVRAPFDGTIAKINIKKSDSAGSGTAVATLVTKQKLAEISLNEVDAAKIKTGQKATLTFDAVEGLNITGEVAEIDTVGAVTQGVVTYSVKIGFDTQDERIKSGMSVSAAIITDSKQDVLTAPNSAVKLQGEAYYVEIFDQELPQSQGNQGVPSIIPPRRQRVEIGLANDTSTEIISGLKEGDQVVVRTIAAAATTAAQQAPSLLGSGGNRSGGGNSVRMPR